MVGVRTTLVFLSVAGGLEAAACSNACDGIKCASVLVVDIVPRAWTTGTYSFEITRDATTYNVTCTVRADAAECSSPSATATVTVSGGRVERAQILLDPGGAGDVALRVVVRKDSMPLATLEKTVTVTKTSGDDSCGSGTCFGGKASFDDV